MLREVCEKLTALGSMDVEKLEEMERQLPIIAALTGNDVFIDCFDGEKAVVASHARPSEGRSLYQKNVVGESVLRENEPAVFRARELKVPVRDIRAVTQENMVVRQTVVPVYGDRKEVIAVLLQEQNISRDIQQRKKYERLARTVEENSAIPDLPEKESFDTAMLREVNHRVKNSLQLVASILNLQARRCEEDRTAEILAENAERILSIAASHDIISTSRVLKTVAVAELLEKVRQNLQVLIPVEKNIRITLNTDEFTLSGEKAGYVAMVVNEFAMNAIRHAFAGRQDGQITITAAAGALYHTISVVDNGTGFDTEKHWGLGLQLAEATVKEQLHGSLQICSSEEGTTASFEMETDFIS
jgi:two-component sensor histidine kinase